MKFLVRIHSNYYFRKVLFTLVISGVIFEEFNVSLTVTSSGDAGQYSMV